MLSMFGIVLISLIVCIGLYTILILSWRDKKYEWHCRIITFLHAGLIVALSGWSAFIQGPWPFTDPAGPNTSLQEYTCAISFGYFIFDFMWCIYFRTEGPVMLFHHVLSMFGNTIVLVRGINGCEMMAALFGTEMTNPLLQLRWFLRNAPYAVSENVKKAVDFSFVLLFTFLRIGVASLLLYCYLTHPRPDFLARGGAISIYVVGWVFWVAIIKYTWFKYVVGKPKKSVSNDSELHSKLLSDKWTTGNDTLNGKSCDKSSQKYAIDDSATKHVGCDGDAGQHVRNRILVKDKFHSGQQIHY